ncbi:MAG: adenosylhomocysteinase [Candidatus Bathyarchaeia archaeon]
MIQESKYWIRDLSLESKGKLAVELAENYMNVLMKIRDRFIKEKPLKGERISACLHITKETAVLVKTLKEGGAEVSLCASNPLSTQDEVAAALVSDGINVYGFKGQTFEEYYGCIAYALSLKPTITIDDGADLVTTLHKIFYKERSKEIEFVENILKKFHKPEALIEDIIGGTEETTTGVIRLRAMDKDGILKYPIIAVNDAKSKSLFDNPIGTGQSALDGIIRATNILIAGKDVVVVGYGQVGSGIAERVRGLGARVTVVEVDPIKALRAAMFGFRVASMDKASEYGDIFITATGNINAIRKEHFIKMKDKAILANAGHFDVEISKKDLEDLKINKRRINPCIEEYVLEGGKRVYLLAEGRLVNLACAEGHPSEIMDMSFAIQALSIEYIVNNKNKLPVKVINVPEEIDEKVARLKLETMGIEIENLTKEQIDYLFSWKFGTK